VNEWNIHQKDLHDPQEPPRKRTGRIAFCPTCKRPFLRGTGVRQPPDPASPPGSPGVPEEPEYCREECLPGRLA